CEIVIDLPSVSRRHARLCGAPPGSDDLATIEDIGGMNGVRVRGQRIPVGQPVPVRPGDVIELGGAIVVLHPPRDRGAPSAGAIARAAAQRASDEDPMKAVDRLIEVVAQSELSVLLLGETGVGKSYAAEAIHARSARANGPLLRLNCAALPEALLEGELFGYERGAFTGAVHDRVGKIELSSGGTLFLDEIESISLNMQLKLLRVLEEREIERLGGNRRIKVNMRVIAATNVDLEALVANGSMREDFYYRINVVPIRIPPLRDRIEDVPLLVAEFLRNSPLAQEKGINRVSNRALQQLMSYSWPGNVRELGNVLERSILRTSGPMIREVDLPGNDVKKTSDSSSRRGFDYEVPLKEFLRRAEKDYLGHVLRKYRGGINSSAKHALVDAATLHRKMKSYGLRREEFRMRGSKADTPIFQMSTPPNSTQH
ncbi:MAG TPA: sigma 54-interacting transcriptional regulator, partial [Candidatus Binatia bacterium]